MKLRTLLALGAASLGLLGYTVHFLGGRADARERAAAVSSARDRADRPDDRATRAGPRDDRDAGHDDGRDAVAIALRSRLERALEAPVEVEPPLPAVQSRVEAETAFEVVMESVEALADKGGRVSKQRRARLYRAANDAFAALSDHLDPSSPRDMAQLEDAHVRLKHMLGSIDAGPPGPRR